MEDLEVGEPSLLDHEEPEANNDPGDPLNPEIDEENSARTPPLAQPTADTEAFEDDEAPETVATLRADEDVADEGTTAAAMDDDNDSELEELDEKEFEDFDPSALNIPDKPVAVDADNVGLLGVHKRKRTEEEEREREEKRRKKKESRKREKPKKARRVRAGAGDEDDEVDTSLAMDGKRRRKGKVGEDSVPVHRAPGGSGLEIDEEQLSPEERRRRALDRKMDEAIKSHRAPTRRRAGYDLESMADAEVEAMRQRMAKACQDDAVARAAGKIATHKLAILPEVVQLMNKNTIQSQIVDPDINLLEAVRFMLEPADYDAALPNIKIQKELLTILSRLPLSKEALIASGIGKVVLFYTRSSQPQPEIKRLAERLIWEWMRVVLGKRKEKRNKAVETKAYDPLVAAASQRRADGTLSHEEKLALAAEKRRKVLAQPIPGNRARADGTGLKTYKVAPVNNLSNAAVGQGAGTSDAAFRRLVARSAAGKKK